MSIFHRSLPVQFTNEMPKRKLVQEASADLLNLSPPPNGLLESGSKVGVEPNGTAKAPSRKKRRTKEVKVETVTTEPQSNATSSVNPARATRKKEVKYEERSGSDEEPKPARGKKRTVKVKKDVKVENGDEDEGGDKKVKRKRKTKEEKEAEAMPLAARTAGHKLFIGAHVSSAGGTICPSNRLCRSCMLRVSRRSQLHLQQRPYWRKCLRALPEVTAEMGESASP